MSASRRRIQGLLHGVGLITACFVTRSLGAQTKDTTASKTAKVSYVTGNSVYISAGREDGLREGASVDLIRGERSVVTLKVAYLSSHQAACEIVTASVSPVVGDVVRYLPSAGPTAATAVSGDSGGGAGDQIRRYSKRNGPGFGLRGRIGARYLIVKQRDSTGTQFSQPALDLRLDGAGLGGSPIGLTADVRARRTKSTLADGSQVIDGRTRIYQASIFINTPGAPFRASFGRQFSPTLATVSIFDGGLLDINKPSWGIGAFGGTQPDPDLGYSKEIAEYGGYIQVHNRPGARSQWSFVTGGIGSYTQGKANREFVYLQGAYTGRHLSSYVAQEIDYNRPWKRALGEPAISATSTFGNILYRFGESFSIHGGIDNRRNVRLYRDVVTPDVAFDDSYRQGIWGGATLFLSRRLRLGFDARSSRGGPNGKADAYTASFGLDRLTPLHLGLRTRHTRYTNPTLSGWLHSGALSFEPSPWLRLEFNGGLRQETNPAAIPADSRVTWYGLDLDLSLGRALYVILSGTRERGGLQADDQAYGGISYRF
jgi:hypothetical protein